jgi:hypothetical protein
MSIQPPNFTKTELLVLSKSINKNKEKIEQIHIFMVVIIITPNFPKNLPSTEQTEALINGRNIIKINITV